MTTRTNDPDQRNESGNVFLFILIGVVLFAALMFTFTRSARQDGGTLASSRRLQLTAADIINYAQGMERAVNKVMLGGVSENQLSFANGSVSGYDNANDCGTDKCRVFSPNGGTAAWENPPPGANDGSPWIISGSNTVSGIGDDTAADLVLLLPNITKALCLKINDGLNVVNPNSTPPVDADTIDKTPFTGNFANTGRIGDAVQLNGIRSACVAVPGAPVGYVYYMVLLER